MKKRTSITMLIAFPMLIALSSADVYCHIKSCGNNHTACIYQKSGPSAHCTGYQGSGLTDDEKHKIVNLHNQLRQKVASGKETRGSPGPQPNAKYMPNLDWDDEVALIAQRWADQCTFKHDSCRNIDRFPVGQNMADSSTTKNINTINVESIVQSWYDEVEYFDKNQVSEFTNKAAVANKVIGHYTQMIWANTTKIGCGASKYKEGSKNKFHLVCNYGPSGNYAGRPVYEIA